MIFREDSLKRYSYKVLFVLAAFFLCLLTLYDKNLLLTFEQIKSDYKNIDTIFNAKNIIANFETEKKGNTKIYANNAQMYINKINNNQLILLRGNVLYSKESGIETTKIAAENVEILWKLKTITDSLNKSNMSYIRFNNNVRMDMGKEFILTDAATYDVDKEIIYGNDKVIMGSKENYYAESNFGFRWNLKDDSFMIERGVEGISYVYQGL